MSHSQNVFTRFRRSFIKSIGNLLPTSVLLKLDTIISSLYSLYRNMLRILGLVFLCFCEMSQGIRTVSNRCSRTPIQITDATGQITSPNYPNKYRSRLNCKWRITSSDSIKLTLEHLDNAEIFDTGKKCPDKLRFASVAANGGLEYRDAEDELCAQELSELPRKVFTFMRPSRGGNTVEISFTSDEGDGGTGFSVYFETMCNETQTGASGVITSLNYPGEYPNYANCFTQIHSPPGSQIEIEFTLILFTNLNVNSKECESDYLEINAGLPGAYGSIKTRYCEESTKTVYIKSEIATIHLVTDSQYRNKGFSATWRAVFPTTASLTTITIAASTTLAETNTLTTTASASTPTTVPSSVIPKNCSYTTDGVLCQRWDLESLKQKLLLPDADDRGHNFCRNPGNVHDDPWCYTTDPRIEYSFCDLDNCIERTADEASSTDHTAITQTPSLSIAKNGSLVGGGDKTAGKNVAEDSAPFLWYPILAAVALLVVFAIGMFFWCKGKNRKSSVAISEPVAMDAVAFHRFDDDDYRPRENTYVEIPFLMEEGRGDDAMRRDSQQDKSDMCGKNFVRLDTQGSSRSSSHASIDSILAAKVAAQREFDRGASTSHDTTTYSVAEDVTQSQAATSRSKQQESSFSQQTPPETGPPAQNVYQAIELESPAENATPVSNTDSAISLSSHAEKGRSSTDTSVASTKPTKKWGFWKKNSKTKTAANNGFTNPTYRKESSVVADNQSIDKNPFDSDVDDSSVPVQVDYNDATRVNDDADVYNAPSVIPKSNSIQALDATNEQHVADLSNSSPYMMPKLSMPKKKIPAETDMVSITPNLIDDADQAKADLFPVARSGTDPISPTFDLPPDFTYDAPQMRTTAKSFSSDQSDSSRKASTFSSKQRDSGNASLPSAGHDDFKVDEYCIMGDSDHARNNSNNTLPDVSHVTGNRASHVYVSMRSVDSDGRRDSEPSVAVSVDIPRTAL